MAASRDKASSCPNCGYPIKPAAKVSAGASAPSATKYVKDDYQSNGLRLFSVSDEHVNLECRNCGKVFSFKREMFSEVSNESCLTASVLACPHCNGTAPQPHAQAKEPEKKTLVNKGKYSGFWFVKKDIDYVWYECKECNKVYRVRRKEFKDICDETSAKNSYTHSHHECKQCGNAAKKGQGMTQKEGSKGVSFWGVVGAIIVALLICCFL